jgi:hypothetical protein
MNMKKLFSGIALLWPLFVCAVAQAQIPRINTFYPVGGKAGTTVTVEIRGSSLDGGGVVLVNAPGVTGTLVPGGSKGDDTFRPVWESKCGTCHELRSPGNRSLTPAQWTATVDRMVKARQAPIAPADQQKIVKFLVAAAASGQMAAQLKIDPDTLPGLYEVRLVTTHGVSTAGLFEVGSLPEVAGVNGRRETAQVVKLPIVANGTLAARSERHYYRFEAKQGRRLVFDLKGYRYNDLTQLFFNPQLRLFDSAGKEIAENHGYYDLDPLLDWKCPADGPYTLEVRDLLGSGNPSSVYRLRMGELPYDTVLYPPAAQKASKAAFRVIGRNTENLQTGFTLAAPTELGVQTVGSPFGPQNLYVSPYPIVRAEALPATPVALPAAFAGHFASPGASDTFRVQGSGPVEFEAYAARIGSPVNLHLSVQNEKGQNIANLNGDTRIRVNLEANQTYTLKVDEPSSTGGPNFVYCIEARPAHPEIECAVHPSNVTLRPGTSAAVQVVLKRRDGVKGEILLTATDLPPGVHATPKAIPGDRNEVLFILTADAAATPTEKPFQILATVVAQGAEYATQAVAEDVYQMNNQPHYVTRTSCVVGVRGKADYKVTFDDTLIKVHPRKGFPFKVKLTRLGTFKGPVQVRIENLPSGWVANSETIQPDKNEVTLLVRPDGNNTQPFMTRDPSMTPLRAVVIANADEFEFVAGTVVVQKDDRPDTKDDKNN